MAAGDRLVITYTGSDERTNASARRPCRWASCSTSSTERCEPWRRGPRDAIVVAPPAAAVRPAQLHAGALAGADPWSFDRVTLDGARQLTHERPSRARRSSPTPLPPASSRSSSSTTCPLRAAPRPRVPAPAARAHARRLLDRDRRRLPVALDGLEEWDVGQRMLDAQLEGCDAARVCLAEMRRGHLPPGVLGKPVVEEIFPTVERIASEAERLAPAAAGTAIDVRLDLPTGVR
jgi:exodeoxyribonuclease V gamma subunit